MTVDVKQITPLQAAVCIELYRPMMGHPNRTHWLTVDEIWAPLDAPREGVHQAVQGLLYQHAVVRQVFGSVVTYGLCYEEFDREGWDYLHHITGYDYIKPSFYA